MFQTTKQIFQDESLLNVEGEIASVAEIFRLQGADELKQAEKKYLPTKGKNINAIILAASQGDRLGELTEKIPKTLLKVGKKTILESQIDEFNKIGIKDVTVVRGFAKEKIIANNIKTIDNDDYANTHELYSLYLALEQMQENTVISYGDILFKSFVLNELLNDQNDIILIVDADFEINGDYRDYTKTDRPYSKKLFSGAVKFEKMSNCLHGSEINGEFIGLWKANEKGINIIKQTLYELSKRDDFKKLRMSDLFNEMVKNTPIAVKYIKGSWLDIDTIVDLQKAGDL